MTFSHLLKYLVSLGYRIKVFIEKTINNSLRFNLK